VEKLRIVERLIKFLDGEFGNAKCALNQKNIYELTIATILSAQCTDEMVNRVTPKLFEKYPDFPHLAKADIEDIKEIIKPTGFFNNKAKSISNLAKKITEDFQGKLPLKIDQMIKLPGIGRKTANVILGEYGTPEGIVVDTHVLRIAQRLGLSDSDNPEKIEKDLTHLITKDRWGKISHQIIQFGRQICTARKPKCHICPFPDICKFYIDNNKKI